ncbi:hypothetical protein WA026_023792 [Henosepilachna vigintioctopunctata]|uniref:Uncharacterized protein n=1 Tax=Henosepilachna vigintioctopunctata TaxID=420089 RepID=A0AAW1V2G7_9CUCU
MVDLDIQKLRFLISKESRDFPTYSGCLVDRYLSSFESFIHSLDRVLKHITHWGMGSSSAHANTNPHFKKSGLYSRKYFFVFFAIVLSISLLVESEVKVPSSLVSFLLRQDPVRNQASTLT